MSPAADSFECYRRFLCKAEGSTYIVVACKREYSNGRNTLRNIILKDEMPCGRTPDRGWWVAQGIANVCGHHVFLYIEHREGSSCGPAFPVDNGPFEYTEEERRESNNYADYIREMQKEGRWQGDRNHPRYPWRKVGANFGNANLCQP